VVYLDIFTFRFSYFILIDAIPQIIISKFQGSLMSAPSPTKDKTALKGETLDLCMAGRKF